MMLGARLTGHIIPENDVFVKGFETLPRRNKGVKSDATTEHFFEWVVHDNTQATWNQVTVPLTFPRDVTCKNNKHA